MLKFASVPAVVLCSARHGGLGIVRSLGRLGVPVYPVHRERTNPTFLSRYCRERILWDIDTAAPERSLRFLEDLSVRIGRRAILIATNDIGTMLIADHSDQLAEWFVFPHQDRALVRALCSKKHMYFLAKKWNVPTPEAAFPRSRADIEHYLKSAQFPLLLKSIISKPCEPPKRLVHTKHELFACFDAEWSISNTMIQEYIPGGDEMTWTFNGYFDRAGECKVASTGRKLRNFPPYFGQASLGVCEHNEQVKTQTIEFMKAIGYRGALDIGYRFDVRDGCYKVNDVNPRIGAMFRLFVAANGMDVARAIYQDMTEQPVLPATAVEGRKWIVEDCDWLSAVRYYRDGNLTLRGWRNSLRGVEEASYFTKDDLWPVAGATVTFLLDRFRGLRRRLNRYRQFTIRQTIE